VFAVFPNIDFAGSGYVSEGCLLNKVFDTGLENGFTPTIVDFLTSSGFFGSSISIFFEGISGL